jgi:MULE transposase domain
LQVTDAKGEITTHFALALASKFGLAMLNAFGANEDRMALLDATGGTNKYNFQLYTLLVVDDFKEGVPCAFLLTSSEGAEEVTRFLKVHPANEEIVTVHKDTILPC